LHSHYLYLRKPQPTLNNIHQILLLQVMFYQMTLSPPRITSKFLASPELFDLNMLTDRTEMVVETYSTDELCRTRITEAMDELIEHYQLA